jgi:hypothetical protein
MMTSHLIFCATVQDFVHVFLEQNQKKRVAQLAEKS